MSHDVLSEKHGGDSHNALRDYGGVKADWLDLSTGISPWVYPIPKIEADLWRELPSPPSKLLAIAAKYYDCSVDAINVTPGSQLAIRLLPTLVSQRGSVAIPELGYQEHAYSWQRAGHQILRYRSVDDLTSLVAKKQVQHAVVINPNNPSGQIIQRAKLIALAAQFPGLLLVDEAFADLDDSNSLCRNSALSNIVILRSIGKFFGLAGARVGFVITEHKLGDELARLLSPWSVNAAAQRISELALKDTHWQTMQRQRVVRQSSELKQLLNKSLPSFSNKSHGLFTTLFSNPNDIKILHKRFAEKQIWTRLGEANCQQQDWLRLSLPGDNMSKFKTALAAINF